MESTVVIIKDKNFEAEPDPYTMMRNQRKLKSRSNIEIDLKASISKVEELNRVIEEHKNLISPKTKAPVLKERLKEQMVVCNIEVHAEEPPSALQESRISMPEIVNRVY